MRPSLSRLAFSLASAVAAGSTLLCAPRIVHAQAAAGVTFSVLHQFNAYASGDPAPNSEGAINSGGAQPSSGLMFAPNGTLYGSTEYGGTTGGGVVFSISTSGSYSAIYNFPSEYFNGYTYNNGDYDPRPAIAIDSSGNLYSTTAYSGPDESGVVYKLTPAGEFSVLHTFTGANSPYTDGLNPFAGLIMGSDGNLYGTTIEGGPSQTGSNSHAGMVYKITTSGILTPLYGFVLPYSCDPVGGVAQASDGTLYGTTSYYGATGSVFKLSTAGALTTLHSFSDDDDPTQGNSDGSQPNASPTIGSDGSIYGTTSLGGTTDGGVIYKVTPDGTYSVLHEFTGNQSTADGLAPVDPMVFGNDGNLYGVASGGAQSGGCVFQISPAGAYKTLYSFERSEDDEGNPIISATGGAPAGALVIGSDGAIYGTAEYGGSGATGVVFKMTVAGLTGPASTTTTPVITTAKTRFDFNQDGHADLIWYNTSSGDVSVWDMDDQAVLQYGATFTQLAPSSGWVPVAAPDANGDGYPDLLWWNKNTGEMSLWTLNGTTVTNYGADFGQITDTDWKPVAVADNVGSSWTLVFQNTATGDISRWLMNGSTVAQYGGTIFSLGANSPYQIVGAPDIDGDGKSDLLFWNDQTGGVSWWGCDLANSAVNSFNGDFAQVSDTSWHLMGSEDANGDGHPDLIWWNANSGIESRWLLDGTTVEQYGGTSTQVADTTWQPTAIR